MKSESLMMTSYTFIFFLLNVAPSLQVRFLVIGPDLPLVIPPGEDAVLPCHLSPQTNAEKMTIRWFKSRYQDLVHLYQRNEDRLENQMDEYRSRTTLNKDEIIAGNVSLVIHKVRPSDSGPYTCFFNTGSFYEEAVMELKVAGLGSKPQIHLEGLQNGGIAVVCESSGWYPAPEALWKDEDGNNISSSTEVKAMDGKLQFHVKATYIFSGHPSTLSCCIRNTLLTHWKQTTVHIRDAFFQRISSCILSRLLISASFTVLGILLISWTIYLFNEERKHSKKFSEKSGELLEEFGKLPEELRWRRVRLFAAVVTLDPDTANPWLILSEDGKSVRMGDRYQDLWDKPQRFTKYIIVLGKERLTSGRHYWEVKVGDKTAWDLGVCDDALKRKEVFVLPERGFWTVRLRNGKCEALYDNFTLLLTPRVPLRTVGLFLDYEAGRLSLYNVDDRSLVFKFPETPFPPTLRPYFNPCSNEEGRNAGPLQILPLTGRE